MYFKIYEKMSSGGLEVSLSIRYQSLLATSRLSKLRDGVTRICDPLVVYLLWIFYVFFCLVFAMPLSASVYCTLWSPVGKGLTS